MIQCHTEISFCVDRLPWMVVLHITNPTPQQGFKIQQDFLTIAQLIFRWERRSIVPASSSQQLPGYRRWNVTIQHRCNRRHLSRTLTTKGKFLLLFSCSYIFWNNKHLSDCLIYISPWKVARVSGHWHLICLSVAPGPGSSGSLSLEYWLHHQGGESQRILGGVPWAKRVTYTAY